MGFFRVQFRKVFRRYCIISLEVGSEDGEALLAREILKELGLTEGGMMDKVQSGVEQFHVKYGCLANREPTMPDPGMLLLRSRLIIEEAAEFMAAASNKDFVGMCDAIADLLYVTYGTAVVMGVDMEPISAEVQRSNMTKDGGGQDSGGKIMKGPDFEEPDLGGKVKDQGWKND